MSDPYLGEMRLMPFGFAPRNWARCDGMIMAIAQNQALFSILGTTFGGDGVRTFGLPDLRGRVPLGAGTSPVGTTYPLGSSGGEEMHQLTVAEVPSHSHNLQGLAAAASGTAFLASLFATGPSALYSKPSTNMVTFSNAVQTVGGLPHTNLQPYQVITMAIALAGVFPSRN